MSGLHFARVFALAIAMVFIASSSVEAKPRKKKSSQVERSRKAKKKTKSSNKSVASTDPAGAMSEAEAELEVQPPEDFATKLDNLVDDSYLEPINVRDPVAVEGRFPGLAKWLHPIVRVEELVSTFPGREFGAKRSGIDRSRRCGRGHCGIDLHAERGRPIIAVADGVLVKVERRRSGGDGMSGRNVRIRHADGTFTTYMHLESVLKGLEVGDEVTAGQQVGTLGSSGVSSHSPHLHFALEIPVKKDDGKGDRLRGYTRWIDPAPFLMKSRVIEQAIRKHSTKPSS